MAKNKKVKKIEDVKRRNAAALAAILRSRSGGGGFHQDRRTRRCRTRSAQKRAAFTEY